MRAPRQTNNAYKDIAVMLRPPEDLTVSEWAERFRTLGRDTSAEPGKWKNSRTPYLVEVMDTLTDPKVREVTFVASSQVGKTEAELCFLGYIIDQDPGTVLFIQPTVDEAKKFSNFRIDSLIASCKTLREKVSDPKSRDSKNTTLQKKFPGGMLTLVGSNAPAGLAGNPIRYVIGDERDRWALSAGKEGDPWGLAKARTTTFYNAKLIDVSTPTLKGYSPIERNFNLGTKERWCVKCPNCGEYHDIKFNDIHFDPIVKQQGMEKVYDAENIYWTCPSCGVIAYEKEVKKQPGKWIAENPDALKKGHRSFWIRGFSSPWQEWKTIILAFLDAKHDHAKMQVVYNTMFGECWERRSSENVSEESLLARREYYGVRDDGSPIDLPNGVLVLTCGVDTQDDRLEYEVVGHGFYGETWGIRRGVLMGDPDYDDVWEHLDDAVVNKVFRAKDTAKALKVSCTFVDEGGHKTQSVRKQCRKRFYRNVFVIKGAARDGIPYTRPPKHAEIIITQQNGQKRVVGKTPLYEIGVNAGKETIMSSLEVQTPGAKYCHFPSEPDKGYDEYFFHGLLSETKVLKTNNGRTRWAWEVIPGHERNEPLDCRNYALAAFQVVDPDLEAVQRRLNGVQDDRAKPKKKRKQQTANRRHQRGMEEW